MAIQTNLFPNFDSGFLAKLMDPGRRVTAKFFVDVTKGVLNGDPDRPGKNKIDPFTGHGRASDVCVKRILRDTMMFLLQNGYEVRKEKGDKANYEYELYVSHRGVLNANNEAVYKGLNIETGQRAEIGLPDKLAEKLAPDGVPLELPDAAYVLTEKDGKWLLSFDGTLDTESRANVEAAFEEMAKGAAAVVKKLHTKSKPRTLDDKTLLALNNEIVRRYADARLVGAVASTGNSCGNVKGPFQFQSGRSIVPIEAINEVLTRVAITRIEDMKDKRADMGRKEPIEHALFEFTFTYSPHLARRVGTHGVVREDLRLFWTAMYNFGTFVGSSMRGAVGPVGVYAFVHDHPLGNAHDHVLWDRVRATVREDVPHPRSMEDYVITVNDADLPDGVELVRLYERKPPTRTLPPKK